ncbi:MAG: 8-oxo-dGTP diphosphatase MutT [Steroidobacteraceae bacterium]
MIHVVAAVVIDGEGRVLIAQRPKKKHLAGGWEFPGGKLEPGEERLAGLSRELREEIGIEIAKPRPLIRVHHSYPRREILLDVWVVRRYSGEPKGLEGQALRWCAQQDLASADLLPADKPIVAALRLPERLQQVFTPWYGITDLNSLRESTHHGRLRGVFVDGIENAAAAVRLGADFLAVRDVLGGGELSALCDSVPAPVFARGIGLEQAWALGASGVNEIGE